MGRQGEAEPVRRITLNSFYMDAYEVTNREYKEFMDAGGYTRREFWTEDGWQWRQTNREYRVRSGQPRSRATGARAPRHGKAIPTPARPTLR